MKVIFGMDPGFASFGFAALGIDEQRERHVLHFGFLETSKRDDVPKAQDNLRRLAELDVELDGAFEDVTSKGHEIVAVAAEAISFVRSAPVMAQIGMVWGVLERLTRTARIPLLIARPQAVHARLTGLKTSTKEQVQDALERKFRHAEAGCPHCLATMRACFKALRKGDVEHPADALATALFIAETSAELAERMAA